MASLFLNKIHLILPTAGLGMSGNMGHIDFYPNGGELMPGCSKNSGSPSNLDGIWEGELAQGDGWNRQKDSRKV